FTGQAAFNKASAALVKTDSTARRVNQREGRLPLRAPFYDAGRPGQCVIDFPQFRNGRRAPAIATRYARRSTLFWIFPDVAPSFFKRYPPGRPRAMLHTDERHHKARMT